MTKNKHKPKATKRASSFVDLVGSGAGKASVDEVKKMLDEMRAEDDL